jgi:four helix bundle protein
MNHMFDHEKLDVYGLELEFIRWLDEFFNDAVESPAPRQREIIDQLDRASLSVLFNTAEGNGKRQGRQRAKFFDDARGSALECAPVSTPRLQSGLPQKIEFNPARKR